MSKQNEDDQPNQLLDDSLAYAQAHAGAQKDDPFAAIKNMRLEQLAQCRLKSAEEMQAMREKSQDSVSADNTTDE